MIPNSTSDISDEYTAYLHQRTGLNKCIAEWTMAGKPNRPNAILEINPTLLRALDARILAQRHLLYRTLGESTKEQYDIPCEDITNLHEGLDSASIKDALDSLHLGSLVISHQNEWMSPKLLQEMVLSGAAKITEQKEGGYIFVVDEINWHETSQRIHDVIRIIRETLGSNAIIHRYTLAPELSMQFAKKLASEMGNRAEIQCREMMNVPENDKSIVWNMEQEKNMPHPETAKRNNLTYRDNRVMPVMFTDELFSIRILTAEQKKQIKRSKQRKGVKR